MSSEDDSKPAEREVEATEGSQAVAAEVQASEPSETSEGLAGFSRPDKLLGHSYDGIQEYDNPLPGWWSFLFIACVVFSPLYALYYHFGRGDLVADEYQADAAAVAEQRAAEALSEPVTDASLRELAQDPNAIAAGGEVFQANCAACHKAKGQGLIGPNLTDAYWINGGSPTDIYQTIYDGVPAKGMVAWGPVLAPDELRQVAAFVMSLQGTDPPDGKAPEGEKYPPE